MQTVEHLLCTEHLQGNRGFAGCSLLRRLFLPPPPRMPRQFPACVRGNFGKISPTGTQIRVVSNRPFLRTNTNCLHTELCRKYAALPVLKTYICAYTDVVLVRWKRPIEHTLFCQSLSVRQCHWCVGGQQSNRSWTRRSGYNFAFTYWQYASIGTGIAAQ